MCVQKKILQGKKLQPPPQISNGPSLSELFSRVPRTRNKHATRPSPLTVTYLSSIPFSHNRPLTPDLARLTPTDSREICLRLLGCTELYNNWRTCSLYYS
jgi:hypothetical protein